MNDMAPDLRLINLETSITRAGDFASGKAVHYRMSPDNVPCLAGLVPDVCALANNHVLDLGRQGLADTVDALRDADLRAVGAAVTSVARESPRSCRSLVGVVSIHWGTNWSYGVPADQRHFAHRLIDSGADVVYGHSSHHPRPIEIYHDKLVLYGCGDFVDDYEGIGGHEEYRGDLRLMYFASLDQDSGTLAGLRMVALQARQMRLHHASRGDSTRLQTILDQVSLPLATRVDLEPDGTLAARST